MSNSASFQWPWISGLCLAFLLISESLVFLLPKIIERVRLTFWKFLVFHYFTSFIQAKLGIPIGGLGIGLLGWCLWLLLDLLWELTSSFTCLPTTYLTYLCLYLTLTPCIIFLIWDQCGMLTDSFSEWKANQLAILFSYLSEYLN